MAKTYPGADISTDHNLLVSIISYYFDLRKQNNNNMRLEVEQEINTEMNQSRTQNEKLQPDPIVKHHEWMTDEVLALLIENLIETTVGIRYYRKQSNVK